jgi:hypothetical protein
MVIGRLREKRDGVHQHHGGRPAVGLVDPPDPAVLVIPSWEILQPLGDLRLVVGALFGRRHVVSLVLGYQLSAISYQRSFSAISHS